jgi:C-terminal processing protease CtpA/Prc
MTNRSRGAAKAPFGAAVSGAVPYQPKMTKAQARATVAANLGSRVRLADYRDKFPPLTLEERGRLLDQAQLMLEQVYVHLPLKRAIHAIDPVQRLRLLKLRHANMNERAFQSELIATFLSLRDLHTNYYLPAVYQQKYAFLPFRVEEFYDSPDPEHRLFLVSWVSPVNKDKSLKEGVVVTHWNGSPISLAVARNAAREAGSNAEAERAQGIDTLTLRWLGQSLPPDEDWVRLTYTDGKKDYESLFEWELVDGTNLPELLEGLRDRMDGRPGPWDWGLDLKTELLRRLRKFLFDAEATRAETEMADHRAATPLGTSEPPPGQTVLPDIFKRFGPVNTPSGRFGYLRIATFVPPKKQNEDYDVEAAVQEFARLLRLLPPTGLILDIRGNPGGIIAFGERILQMLTPWEITPEPFHFITTPLTLAIAQSNNGWSDWKEPIEQGIETGASYSQGFSLTSFKECNDIGQIYQGPVVLITDALCYSTADIFAAGFQDHAIGDILGTQGNTGAGGATVWGYYEYLQQLVFKPNPFAPLPQGVDMRVAALRSTRLGNQSGVPLEDLGVKPDATPSIHYMTRADVLNHNVDLIARAAQILAGKERQRLLVTGVGGPPVQKFKIEAQNVNSIDVMVNDRTVLSVDVNSEKMDIALSAPVQSGTVVKLYGYRNQQRVVSTWYQA